VTNTVTSPWSDPLLEASWIDLKLDPPPDTKTASFFLLTALTSCSSSGSAVLQPLLLHHILQELEQTSLCTKLIACKAPLGTSRFWDWTKGYDDEESRGGKFKENGRFTVGIDGASDGFGQNLEIICWASMEKLTIHNKKAQKKQKLSCESTQVQRGCLHKQVLLNKKKKIETRTQISKAQFFNCGKSKSEA